MHHVLYFLFLPILVSLGDLIPIKDAREKSKLKLCIKVLLVWTFYSTRLVLQKFYLEKKLSSESSRVKFKNDNPSTQLSFYGFILSDFRVLVE